ncbi:MAG: ArsR/SmtB family transcription factor [Pseudobdellovibrionaceae bacterium]
MDGMDEMQEKALEVSEFMKCFSSPHRLMILCQLVEGEKSVSELIDATGMAQTSMSQHLGKLKLQGLVDFRREHRTLYYMISDPNAFKIMESLYEIFCKKQ